MLLWEVEATYEMCKALRRPPKMLAAILFVSPDQVLFLHCGPLKEGGLSQMLSDLVHSSPSLGWGCRLRCAITLSLACQCAAPPWYADVRGSHSCVPFFWEHWHQTLQAVALPATISIISLHHTDMWDALVTNVVLHVKSQLLFRLRNFGAKLPWSAISEYWHA